MYSIKQAPMLLVLTQVAILQTSKVVGFCSWIKRTSSFDKRLYGIFLMTMAIQEIGEENLSFLSETKSLIFLLYCRIILKTNYFGKAKLCIIGLTRNKSS